MFLLSGSLAVYSAWLLWRGEEAEAVLGGLPAGCDRVALLDKPGATRAIARQVARHAVQWTGGGQAVAMFQGLSADPPPSEIADDQAIALCQRSGRWFGAAVPAASANADVAARAFAQWIGAALGHAKVGPSGSAPIKGKWGRWVSVAGSNVLWIARAGEGVVQAAWSASAATPTDSPEQAEAAMDDMLAAIQAGTLQKDEPFRAALERTGGGDVHTFERGRQLTAALRVAPGWSGAAEAVEWRGAALRVENSKLIVHEHLGGGQRLAAWLKQHFDMPTEFDATAILPADGLKGWGVDRYPHLQAVELDLTDVSLPARRAAMPSPTGATDKLWRATLAGPVAWFVAADGCKVFAAPLAANAHPEPTLPPAAQATSPCTNGVRKWTNGWLLAGSIAGVAQVERLLSGQDRSIAEAELDRDAKRMATATNGWRSGTGSGLRVLEWTWVDTGVVVERTYPAD